MAEHEFGETMEMIFYVVLFAFVIFYAGFLYVVNTRITYHYDYSVGEATTYALWVVRASNLTLKDLNNHATPYIINATALLECHKKDLSCVGQSLPLNTELIFILPRDKGEDPIFYKKFEGEIDYKNERIVFRQIIPVIYYYDKSYLAGRVEVVSYGKE